MKKIFIALLIILSGLVFSIPANACTSFILKTTDGSPVYGRSMEWGLSDFKSNLVMVPRGLSNISHLSANKRGITWKNKYGFVGVNAFNLPFYMDGMNETGLTVGTLFLPDLAEFQSFDPNQKSSTLNSAELVGYILSQFSTVEEIKAALPKIRVVDNPDTAKAFGAPVVFHLVVTDNTAHSIVIEYINAQLTIYDNNVGIMTNAPSYDWHIRNLRNYTHLSPYALGPGDATIAGVNFTPFGAGYGMTGLPGDYTPPSRFIRAFFFAHNSVPLQDSAAAVEQALHILNNFDIPTGSVREGTPDNYYLEYTQWSVIGDIKNKCYYWWTKWNRQIRMVNLTKLNFVGNKPIAIPLDTIRKNTIEDRTSEIIPKN